MVEIAESSSSLPKDEKPVIVRVKRKVFQSPLDGFWLEINERPLKRPLLDFEKLSISSSSAKVEELKTKKVFVQHVETVSSSEDTVDVLQSFVPGSTNGLESKAKGAERRHTYKADKKQDQLLVKAKEKQEFLSKNARFEQIWRSRKGKKHGMHGEALRDMCHLYDVVRVDAEETATEVQEQEDADLEDQRIMASFLPLLKEFIPSAAEEIESDISDHTYKQATIPGSATAKDDYVYDLYAVKDGDISMMDDGSSNLFPLVQVDDDDTYYDGPDQSEFESDDSNAEDNPINDYPEEETSEGEEEDESKTSESEDLENEDWLEDEDPWCDYEDGDEMHDYEGGEDDSEY